MSPSKKECGSVMCVDVGHGKCLKNVEIFIFFFLILLVKFFLIKNAKINRFL